MESGAISPAVTAYFYQHQGWQLEMLLWLRRFILNLAPQMQEQFKYGGAFYYCHGTVCYLGPQKDHVYIGFVEGVHLSNGQKLFSEPDTKQIRKVRLYPHQPIPELLLRELFQEAILYNQLKQQAKLSKKKTTSKV